MILPTADCVHTHKQACSHLTASQLTYSYSHTLPPDDCKHSPRRRAHAQVADIIVYATNQAAPKIVA
eukprot:7377215-Prymnesium_polylepis.1